MHLNTKLYVSLHINDQVSRDSAEEAEEQNKPD